MKPLRAVAVATALAAGTATSCDNGEPAGPAVPAIVGTWDLIGFSDAGVEAEASGSWTFRADGTHSFEGTVVFPGEPPDDISGDGTYELTGTTLVLTVGADSSTWTVVFAGDLATLTEDEAPPANTIALRRA